VAIGRGADGRVVYVIDADGSRLHIRLTGMWSDEVFVDFVRDFRAAVRSLSAARDDQTVLCDATAWPVQRQTVAEQFNGLLGSRLASQTRMAVACGTALLAMQVRRVAARSTLRVFTSLPDAFGWLGSAS
jgi:hypothetical protein